MLGWGVLSNSDFSFLGQVFQFCFLGLKACLLRIASFGIRTLRLLNQVYYPFTFCFLLSFYLLPFVFFIPSSFFLSSIASTPLLDLNAFSWTQQAHDMASWVWIKGQLNSLDDHTIYQVPQRQVVPYKLYIPSWKKHEPITLGSK